MQPHTFLYDLTSILGVVPGLATVSFTPQPDGTVWVRGLSEHKQIVLDTCTREPVDGLDQYCGININAAKSVLHAPGMLPTNVQSRWEGESTVHLKQGYQHYRLGLMSGGFTAQIVRPPPLKIVPNYETFARPTTEGNALLKHWRREICEEWGMPDDFKLDLMTKGNALLATFKWGPKESITFPLTEFSTGKMNRPLRIRSHLLMQLLPLVERTRSTLIQILDQGLVTIEVQTTHCSFKFHIPCYLVDEAEYAPPEWHAISK